jgi:hypothetical protein
MSEKQAVPAASPVTPIGQILTDKKGIAEALGVSQRTIDHWRSRGTIPYLSFGPRFLRFNIVEVLQAVEKFKVRPKAKDHGATTNHGPPVGGLDRRAGRQSAQKGR